jgi:hypothetical protein
MAMALGCERRADDRNLVVDDQLLCQALGVVGNTGIILDDEIDLLAGDGVAVLLHVKLDAGLHLLADGARPPVRGSTRPTFAVSWAAAPVDASAPAANRNSDLTQHEVSSLGGSLAAIYIGTGRGSWLKKRPLRTVRQVRARARTCRVKTNGAGKERPRTRQPRPRP